MKKGIRLVWVDSLKGWLILLVVLGHAIQNTLGVSCDSDHLWNLIYSFHMPAFMAVSGYVAFRPTMAGEDILTYTNIIIRRFRQLIIPFIIWTFLLILLKSDISLGVIINYILYPDKGLWFLWVLFFISALFITGSWISDITKIKLEWVISSICLFWVIVMVVFEPRLFGFQFIAYYFLFYSFGYFIHKYREKVITKKNFILVTLFVIWFILAWFWRMHSLPDWLKFIPLPISLMQYAYRFITAAIAIFILFSAFPMLLNSDKEYNRPFIRLGELSLGIYTTHFIIIGRTVIICRGFNLSEPMVIATSFVIALLISWLIVWALSKSKITAKYFLGKI